MTSAVLPGHISEHTGRPSPSITRQDHVPKVRPMIILPVAVLPERLPAGALEYRLVRFIKYQVEAGEADLGGVEQSLLDRCAANCARR